MYKNLVKFSPFLGQFASTILLDFIASSTTLHWFK